MQTHVRMILAVVAVSLSSLASAATVPEAVAYQGNTAHNGNEYLGRSLTLPLKKGWHFDYDGLVSYPLIAGGRVFFLAQSYNTSGSEIMFLYALDSRTGAIDWGPIALGDGWHGFAYDNGSVFVLQSLGQLTSYDAATGTPNWTVALTGQGFYESPPSATGGKVYVIGAGLGGTLYSVNETDGSVGWQKNSDANDMITPTVSGSSVVVDDGCDVWDYNLSGQQRWHVNSGCEGGGGYTMAMAGGLIYMRDYLHRPAGVVLSGKTGTATGHFESSALPAIGQSMGYFQQEDGPLLAMDLATQQYQWKFSPSGDFLNLPPVIINNQYVLAPSPNGNLYVLDATTGALLSTTAVGSGIGGPDDNGLSIWQGIAVADGLIAIATQKGLVTYY